MTRRTVPLQWITVDEEMPDADLTVMLTIEGDPEPWGGYWGGECWRDLDGMPLAGKQRVIAWAEWPEAYA
jgi:hypothetical protein